MRTSTIAMALGALVSLVACRSNAPGPAPDAASSAHPGPAISAPISPITPRHGMLWVPPGALVAGTPPGSVPRMPDQEIPGEQLILKGFYIDVYPYPDEEGAIPLTNVTRDAAAVLCVQRGKRLCSELEWERACKGPLNQRFEYGNGYRAERCGTGEEPLLRPVGLRVGCRSDFGVRDLHGGAFEWTASAWGRGSHGALGSVRGGNSPEGELVARCANAMPRDPDASSGTIGFRCCAGEANSAEVTLEVHRGSPLDVRERMDASLLHAIVEALPKEAHSELEGRGRIVADRSWLWRPVGNEELYATRVCSGLANRPACGVFVSRATLGRVEPLAWASSNHWAPHLEVDRDPRDLWMIGGDVWGTVQRLVQYRYGTIRLGEEEHRARLPQARPRGRAEPAVRD